MGGPSASILLRTPLTGQQVDDLETWLRANTSGLQATWLDWCFLIRDGTLLGITEDCSINLCTCRLSAYDPAEFVEEVEKEQVIEATGYYPQQAISIYVGCNRPIHHRILGHLALFLAERYGGLIHLDGAITPPLQPGRNYKLKDYPWHTLEEIHDYVQSLPGRVIEVLYEVDMVRLWVYHIVDATFMRAWLKQSHFHMIK